uniref:Uncharacterized protein n=1 Tax=Arundo donax TaxID=35708 RepID=A0A0A9GUI7_ARUDO
MLDPAAALFNIESWATWNNVLLDHHSRLIHYGNM